MQKIMLVLVIVVLMFLTSCGSYASGKVCGTHTETYTSSAEGCDKMSGCSCLHHGALGLGTCDSCQCAKEVSNC